MRSGTPEAAIPILETALQTEGDIALWLNLAAARRALGQIDASLGAVEGALRLDPRYFPALLMKASLLERRGDLRSAGVGYGIALTQAPNPDLLDPPTRKALDHARAFHAQYVQDLRARLVEAASGAASHGSGVEAKRIRAFIDHLAGSRKVYPQRPTAFHYPGLPAIEFYENADFPWLAGIEAAADTIREELIRLLSDAARADDFAPYVSYPEGVPIDQWAELNHSPRWSAFHLCRDGGPVPENAALCPATMAALATAPQPRVRRRSPAAMFSVLRPKTRIPPHTGVSNTRLVVHLPLILPADCGFRVGNETRAWRRGEAWVFDDTIEHEAWNHSDLDRTILIFDIWSPFLSASERELIAQVTAAADLFNEVEGDHGL
jgi:aspartyl/asparaginyl beta-hydroxylase (cupin superfamily)